MMSNKHKHYEMIVAKSANMDLVVFSQNQKDGSWLVQNDQGTTDFGDCINYFLCLPQHKEAVINLLNGGESQLTFNGEHWDKCNLNEPAEWSYDWWYMKGESQSRIKPKKEKRWIATLNGWNASRKVFASKQEAVDLLGANSYQFHEIEVEV